VITTLIRFVRTKQNAVTLSVGADNNATSIFVWDCSHSNQSTTTTTTEQEAGWWWLLDDDVTLSTPVKVRSDVTNIQVVDHRDDDDGSDDHGVAVCAIQKGSEGYIDEWVYYYLGLGVSKVIIYDNSDGFDLEGWYHGHHKDTVPVEVYHLPGKKKQLEAYRLCINRIRDDNRASDRQDIRWVAMYDVDEYLVMTRHRTIGALLRDHCPVEKGCGGLLVNWYKFHSANETSYSPVPMPKRFPYRSPRLVRTVKSIVHVDRYLTDAGNPHCFLYDNNVTLNYDTTGPKDPATSCPHNYCGTATVASLHHFHTKSRAEFNYRCVRGDADLDTARCPQFEDDPPGLVRDDSAWQILKRNVPAYRWYDDPNGGAGMFGYG
jgi:hypothetical protein